MKRTVFTAVMLCLLWIARMLGITYAAANILLYYLVIPLIYAVLLDKVIGGHMAVLSVVILFLIGLVWKGKGSLNRFSEWLFGKSERFLCSFNWLGWDYVKASIAICVILPVIILIALLFLAL